MPSQHIGSSDAPFFEIHVLHDLVSHQATVKSYATASSRAASITVVQ